MAPDDFDSAVACAGQVAGEDGRDRTAVAKIEDAKQTRCAGSHFVGSHWVHDHRTRPVWTDLDLVAPRAVLDRICDVGVVPLAAELAHPVFGDTHRTWHGEKLFEPSI